MNEIHYLSYYFMQKDYKAIDGKWSSWSSWSGCSKTCGSGESRKWRTCTDPPPSGGGDSCDKDKVHLITKEIYALPCNSEPCPGKIY